MFLQSSTSHLLILNQRDANTVTMSPNCLVWLSTSHLVVIQVGKEANSLSLIDVIYAGEETNNILVSHEQSILSIKGHDAGKFCPDPSRVMGEAPCKPYGNQKGRTSDTSKCDGDEGDAQLLLCGSLSGSQPTFLVGRDKFVGSQPTFLVGRNI